MPFGILRFLHLNLERSPRTPQRINPNHEAGLRFCVCFFRDSSGVRGFCPPMCANSPICTVACTNVPFILKFRHYVFGENASEKKRAQPKAATWAPKNGKTKWPKGQERFAMHTQRTQDAAKWQLATAKWRAKKQAPAGKLGHDPRQLWEIAQLFCSAGKQNAAFQKC